MKRLAIALLAFTVAASGASAQTSLSTESRAHSQTTAASDPRSAGATNVLFVGNSLTYYNEMPWIFEQIAKSLGVEVHATFSGLGGATLKTLWDKGDVRRALTEHHFDFVVLQAQSSEILRTPDTTRRYAAMLASAVRDAGGQPIIFAAWPPNAFMAQQMTFRLAFRDLARSLHVRLAPVDVAWHQIRAGRIELYTDGAHPNLAGSYLAACVIYSTIFSRDPAGATHTFDVHFQSPETYRAALENEKIDEPTAIAIQRAAWTAVRDEQLAKP